jgi:predicted Zn-ribbon and HTH transcriptional regulator
MAVKIVRRLSYMIKTKFGRKSNRYARLERSPSEEELENVHNEQLESAIREGLRQGAVILVLPPPLCKKCGQQV